MTEKEVPTPKPPPGPVCVECGVVVTPWCCSDCAIDGKGKVYVCSNIFCQTQHDLKHSDVMHIR